MGIPATEGCFDVVIGRRPMVFLRFVVGVAVIFGPVLALLILLNRRDRCISRLCLAVSEPLALAELRGRIAVQVQCAVLSGGSTVNIDILACTYREMWDIFTRVASRLPPRACLLVNGVVGQQAARQLTLETMTRRLVSHHSWASLVAD
jgi:hypothetical protein